MAIRKLFRRRRLLPTCAVLLLGVVATGDAVAQSRSKRKSKPRVSVVNKAYAEIKKKRDEILDDYLKELYKIADECAKDGLVESGKEITGRILAAVEPPRNRRKIRFKSASGVAVTKGSKELVRLKEVQQVPMSPEATARLEKAREKVKSVREQLGIQSEDEASAGYRKPSTTRLKPRDDEDEDSEGEGAEESGSSQASKKSSKEDEAIYRKERSARKKMVRAIEKLVNRCVQYGFPAHGYEVLLWALKLDSENKSLRGILGQRKYKGKWYSNYDYRFARSGYIEHPEYGWQQPAQIKALKAGKVWFKNDWHPRDEVERERQKWENRWLYETEHFKIETNAPLRDAVEFGREVERLYSFFYRVFIDFFAPDDRKGAREIVFKGGKALGNKKLGLHYYRSYEHYLSEVKRDPELVAGFKQWSEERRKQELQLLAQSAGFYYTGTGKAYFFRNEDGPDLSTIYHEVTHQLFGETYAHGVGAPTWLVEGFGVFMEDPVIRGERLIAAAEPPPGIKSEGVRDLNEFIKKYHVDQTFHGGGRGDNYATGGAVVHFFLFYNGGIYRKPFMRYAREAYRNTTENSPTHTKKLYEYLGISEEKLQADWEAFNKEPDLFDF